MPQTTDNYSIPYPVPSDPVDITGDIEAVAKQVDTVLESNFSSIETDISTLQSDVFAIENTLINIKKITANPYTALDKDFIISDFDVASVINLPTSPNDKAQVTMTNYGTGQISVSASAVINGVSSVPSESGLSCTFKDGEWWCLPLSSSQGGGGDEWTRPTDWLTMPTPSVGEDVIYGIARIKPDSENLFVIDAFNDYKVIWGDGTAEESFSGGNKARHKFDFSSVSASTITSDGSKQVIIEIRPQEESTLTNFGSPSVFYEILVHSSDFSNTITPFGFRDCESILIKEPNNITSISDYFISDHTPNIKNFYAEIPNVTSIGAIFYTNGNMSVDNVALTTSSALSSINYLFYYTNFKNFSISNTSAVESFNYFFEGALIENDIAPNIDTSAGTSFQYMFSYSNVKKIPLYDMSNALNISYMFRNSTIESLPALDLSSVTSANDFCYSAGNLMKSDVYGLTVSHSYVACNLSGTELNNIYQNLGTTVSGIINVTENPGVSSDNPSIAIAKGWTVTG